MSSTEEGTRVMCEVMEKYTTEARNEGWTKGRAEGNIDAVVNMLKPCIDESSVKKCYPDEFEEGKKQFIEEKN